MSEPCWCSGPGAGCNFGVEVHEPGEICPVREYWLEVEDSEF